MTVHVQNPISSSIANGVTKVFPYSFMIASADDLAVTLDGVLQVSGFTVSGVGNPAGGDVTFSVTPANGKKVVSYLSPIVKRDTDYQQFGDWTSAIVNLEFDRIWLALGAIMRRTKNALRLSDYDTSGASTVLPTPVAGRGLKWNGSATAIVHTDRDPDAEAAAAAAYSASAAAYASNSSASAAASAASAASAAASYDSFDDRYLGAKATPPTLDNDGNALITGALYFNTTSNTMQAYDGASWGNYQAAAAASAVAAAAAQTASETAQGFAETAQAGAEVAQYAAETAEAGAQAARDAAIAGSFKTWPTTAAGVGNGIAGVTSIVGGSGGTNGTFALAYSGGPQVLAPVGVFTVAGGALVSVVITYPGYYSSGTPTLSFAASSGLSGASATAQMAANTPVNGYFCVPSAVSGEAAIVYKNVAGTATEVVRTPSSTQVAINTQGVTDLKTAFDFTPPKNKFNPALPQDGYLYNYGDGSASVYANGIISGKQAVVEGNRYTLSMTTASGQRGFFNVLFFWNAAGAFLGLSSEPSSGHTVIPNINLAASESGGASGYRILSFDVPVGSGIAYVGAAMWYNYGAHSTADFNAAVAATQLEIHATRTAYVPYTLTSQANLSEATTPAFVQRAASVVPLTNAFDVIASRQLYNKANAVDGMLISYSTGLNSAYANGISLGYFPVEAGKTYCLSMLDSLGFHSDHPLYCRDADGVFLGIDHTIGGYTGMASPPTGVTWTGNSQVVFTIPGGSAIRYVGTMAAYASHDTSAFNRVIGSAQAEEGTAATALQAYTTGGIGVLKETSKPATQAPLPPLKVVKSGNDVYIRASFNATTDIIQYVSLSNGVNSTVNSLGAKQIAAGILNDAYAYAGGTVLEANSDESTPLYYNGTYIGANHGANFIQEVTATGHGKAVADVGSEWTDGAAVKWYLMKIVDVNTLWFLSQNNSSYPAWSFTTTITGATLTHSSGATHTGSITVASSVLTQLTPCLQAQTATVLLDGITPMSAGTASANTLHIVNECNITNPASVLAYVRSLVGGSTQPDFVNSSIDYDVRRSITYVYAENGSCTISDGIYINQAITFGYSGSVQAGALTLSGGDQLMQYIPRVSPIVGGVKTWDFQARENIAGTFEELHLTSTYFTDANNPPDRMAQIVRTSGSVPKFGLMVGYSPLRSVGLPATRKTLINEACFISAARKQYPKALTAASQPAGSYYETVAFRAFWDASANTSATCLTWYRDGKNIIVMADFHATINHLALQLPSQFTGMNCEVIDKSGSATLHGNGVVMHNGILVSSSGSYGYLVLKLS